MPELDWLFEQDPLGGVPDIWFSGLGAVEVADLFDHACQTFGAGSPTARWVRASERQPGRVDALHDALCVFEPLQVDGVALQNVWLRIERDRVAVDFVGGLAYWSTERQAAFLNWLARLCRRVPSAQLVWAREGEWDRPSEPESTWLRQAVARVA